MARKKKQKLDDAFLSSHGSDRFQVSNTWRQTEIEQQWVDSSRQYDSQFKITKDKEKSDVLVGKDKLFIPKTYTHTQRILVDLLEAFFSDPEEIISVGSWKGVPADHKRMVKMLLNYRLNSNPIDFFMEAYEVCLDALKNKVGIMKIFPKFSGEGTKGYSPQMLAIPYEDVFFDQSATWKDYHQKTIIHRMKLPLDHLKRKKYKNLDQFDAMNDDVGTDEVKDQRREDQGDPFSQKSEVDAANNVFVYDIMTHLDVNGDGLLESCNYLMGGGQVGPEFVIRGVEENELPYKKDGEDYNRPSIVVGQAFPEPHKMYGKDLPGITEGLQREANSTRNQRREAVALGLRPPTLVMRGSGVDLMSLVNRRIGGVVMGNDVSPTSVREMDVRDATAGSYRESAINDQDFMEATSVPPNLLGASSPGEQSATESVQQDQNANKKIALIIKCLAHTVFLPSFKMLLRLEQTYESDKVLDMVAGRIIGAELGIRNTETGKISPIKKKKAIIEGEFDLKVNLGVNKQVQLNKWFLLIDRGNQTNASITNMVQLGVISPQSAKFIDVAEMYDKVLQIMGEKDFEEFKIQAQQPPPQEGGATAPGQASQPALPGGSPIQAVSNLNPGG
jgi:hypothetical protein